MKAYLCDTCKAVLGETSGYIIYRSESSFNIQKMDKSPKKEFDYLAHACSGTCIMKAFTVWATTKVVPSVLQDENATV